MNHDQKTMGTKNDTQPVCNQRAKEVVPENVAPLPPPAAPGCTHCRGTSIAGACPRCKTVAIAAPESAEMERQKLVASLNALHLEVDGSIADDVRDRVNDYVLAFASSQNAALQQEIARLEGIYLCSDGDTTPLLSNILKWPSEQQDRITNALIERTNAGAAVKVEIESLRRCNDAMVENEYEHQKQLAAQSATLTRKEEEITKLDAALKGILNERDTDLDMMHCRYANETPENAAWHDGVVEAWKRFRIVKDIAKRALQKSGPGEQ